MTVTRCTAVPFDRETPLNPFRPFSNTLMGLITLLIAGSLFGLWLYTDSLSFACVIKGDGSGKACYTNLEMLVNAKAGSLRARQRALGPIDFWASLSVGMLGTIMSFRRQRQTGA